MPRVKLEYSETMGRASAADYSQSNSGFGHHDFEVKERAERLMTSYENMSYEKAKGIVEKQLELEHKVSDKSELQAYTKNNFIDDKPKWMAAKERRDEWSNDLKFQEAETSIRTDGDFANDFKELKSDVKSIDKRLSRLSADFSNHIDDFHQGISSVKREKSDFLKSDESHQKVLAPSHANFSNSQMVDEWGDTTLYNEFNNQEVLNAPKDADTLRIINKSMSEIKKSNFQKNYAVLLFNIKNFFKGKRK